LIACVESLFNLGMLVASRFRYWEIDSWKEFLSRDIVNLYLLCEQIYKTWKENIVDVVKGRTLKDISDNEFLFTLLTGGISEKGEYKANALAKLVKEFFGVYIEDPKLFATKRTQEGEEYPKISIIAEEEPQLLELLEPRDIYLLRLIDYIKLIRSLLDSIISDSIEMSLLDENALSKEIKPIENVDEFINMLKALIESLINLTPAYSEEFLFLWMIRKITRNYYNKHFPKIALESDLMTNILGLDLYYQQESSKYRDWDLFSFQGYLDQYKPYRWCHRTYVDLPSHTGWICPYRNTLSIQELKEEKFSEMSLGGKILLLSDITMQMIKHDDLKFKNYFPNISEIDPNYVLIQEIKEALKRVSWELTSDILRSTDNKQLFEGIRLIMPYKDIIILCTPHTIEPLNNCGFKIQKGVIKNYVIYRNVYNKNTGQHEISVQEGENIYLSFPILLSHIMPAIIVGFFEPIFDEKKENLIIIKRFEGVKI